MKLNFPYSEPDFEFQLACRMDSFGQIRSGIIWKIDFPARIQNGSALATSGRWIYIEFTVFSNYTEPELYFQQNSGIFKLSKNSICKKAYYQIWELLKIWNTQNRNFFFWDLEDESKKCCDTLLKYDQTFEDWEGSGWKVDDNKVKSSKRSSRTVADRMQPLFKVFSRFRSDKSRLVKGGNGQRKWWCLTGTLNSQSACWWRPTSDIVKCV